MKKLLAFVAGAVVGAVVATQVTKNKYEQLIDEEVESVREMYKKRLEKATAKKEEPKPEEPQEIEENVIEEDEEEIEEIEEIEEYEEIASQYNYEEANSYYEEPYIIDAEDFGNDGDYQTLTFTYFADGIMVDDVDEVIVGPEALVGTHHIDIFEEFPNATAVYIRNDLFKTDYKILKDDWLWSDIQAGEEKLAEKFKKPHQL